MTDRPTSAERRAPNFDASLWWKDEWRPCGCQPCADLLDEYGATRYAQIFVDGSVKRGWAGGYNRIERAWLSVHGTPGYLARRARAIQAWAADDGKHMLNQRSSSSSQAPG